MRKITLQVILSVAIGALFLAPQAFADRYIVKLTDEVSFQALATELKEHKEVFGSLGMTPLRQGVPFLSTRAEVTDSLNNLEMFVVEGEFTESEIEALVGHSAVEFIEKETMIPAPAPVSFGGAYEVGAGPLMEVPWGILAVRAFEAWELAGKGEGIRVMVLDTGIDQGHASMLSNFEQGKDFVGDKGDVPYDYFDQAGHGTHVAGTILADGETTGLVGVAPKARLLAGRVCGNNGCPSFAVLAGVDWAIEQGVDVVNMSLGGSFPSSAARRTYERAEEAGVMIVAASGNDGRRSISYPAGYDTVFSVGAVNPDLTLADFSNWGHNLDLVAPGVEVLSAVPRGTGRTSEVLADLGQGPAEVKSAAMDGSGVVTENLEGQVMYAGLGQAEDFQNVDVDGKIALIQRGEIAFGDKAKNAIDAGASAVIIFNNESGLAAGTLGGEVSVPVVMIEQTSGARMVELLDAGLNLEAAVGTLPSDYMELAGTSMASPHAAGVAALVRGANPALTPAEVRQILRETAVSKEPNPENKYGEGLIDAAAAVERALNFGLDQHLAAIPY